MSKVNLANITNLQNESVVVGTINTNNDLIEEAFDNTLSRNGANPNNMNASLDMNSNRILNLPDALNEQEPATLGQLIDYSSAINQGAVVNASYVTLGNDPVLQNERVLTAGTNILVTDGGAGGVVTVGLDNTNLNDLAAHTTPGILTLVTTGDVDSRTITGTANEITVSNGSGVSGNPTISLPSAITLTGKTVTGGTFTGGTYGATSLTVPDNAFTIQDDGDATKQARFQASGITTGTTRTLTIPNADTTIVGTDTTQTLTNKSVNLTNNTLTGTRAQFNTAMSDDDFASLTGTETLTNKTINLTSNTLSGTTAQFNTALSDNDFATLAGSETLTNKTVNLTSNTLTGTRAQFNTAMSDDDFVTLTGTETLTNKTLTSPTINTPTINVNDNVFSIRDNGDTTKIVQFEVSGVSTGTTRTLTVPNASTTLVGTDTTQTLTNKTLTSPSITTPTGIVKGDVGLGNVDNTSDATKNSATATLTNKTIDTAGPNTIRINGNTLSATAGSATVTIPNSTDTLVGRATTDTLTNKTLTSPVISTISNTGTITLPTSTDTLVGRATTDTLTNKSLTSPVITGTADIQQAVSISGDISPAQITSNQNDYAPTGFSTASVLRLSTDASRDITGLAGGSDGRKIWIYNTGSFSLVLKNESASSSAANRFGLSGDATINGGQGASLIYDSTASRWRIVGSSAGSGGGGGGGDLLSTNNLSDVASKPTSRQNLGVYKKGADIASASTVDLTTTQHDLVDVTGTTTITAFTMLEGDEKVVRFTGALTITNGASLILPGNANIVTRAGDVAILRGYASNVVRMINFQPYLRPAFFAKVASSTTISHNAYTKLPLATELMDNTGAFDNTANAGNGYRFTPQQPGIYLVDVEWTINGTNSHQLTMTATVFKNGSVYGAGPEFGGALGTGAAVSCHASVLVSMNGTTDYLEGYAYQFNYSTGGSGNISPASQMRAVYMSPN